MSRALIPAQALVEGQDGRYSQEFLTFIRRLTVLKFRREIEMSVPTPWFLERGFSNDDDRPQVDELMPFILPEANRTPVGIVRVSPFTDRTVETTWFRCRAGMVVGLKGVPPTLWVQQDEDLRPIGLWLSALWDSGEIRKAEMKSDHQRGF